MANPALSINAVPPAANPVRCHPISLMRGSIQPDSWNSPAEAGLVLLGAGGFSAAKAHLFHGSLPVEVSIAKAKEIGQHEGHDKGSG